MEERESEVVTASRARLLSPALSSIRWRRGSQRLLRHRERASSPPPSPPSHGGEGVRGYCGMESAPPLPGPLLHPMEERESEVIAAWRACLLSPALSSIR